MTFRQFLLAIAVAGFALAGFADERILSYHSDIAVNPDGSLLIRETITVQVDGNQIQRGIYRDFPVLYTSKWGLGKRVPFDVEDVTRNGEYEPFVVEWNEAYRRVRIGREAVLLDHGTHTYVLTYRTDDQLGFFEDHDELYWNVTGTRWDFPIDEATASVTLPAGIPHDALTLEGYTGVDGSKETAFRASVDGEGVVHYHTTRSLLGGEGLTLVIGFPTGHITAPTPQEATRRLLRDNRDGLAMGIGWAGLLVYYLVAWTLVGKDPEKGTIIPQYEPPEGISPAAARYIMKMGYDNRCFAAAVINLGVRGRLRIIDGKKYYTVERRPEEDHVGELSLDEAKLFQLLLGRRRKMFFKQQNHRTISAAVEGLTKSLKEDYQKTYFLNNRKYWVPGFLITALALAAAVAFCRNPGQGLFMGFWLSMWSIGVIALGAGAAASWKAAFTGPKKISSTFSAVGLTLFALPFFAGEAMGLFALSQATSPITILFFILSAATIFAFYQWMKAPTRLGRQIMDHLEGFQRYLSVAEEDRLRLHHPPQKTAEHFEAYLPYALALDVEQEWAEYFADVIAATGHDTTGDGHHAHWYSGSAGRMMGIGAVATGLGTSLASAVSSSSSAPGSSSGGGGGGSSGGGGGGGGGGGW